MNKKSTLLGAPSADSAAAPNLGLRIIKKYPNRRLYDTATSTYITLAEIKDIVMQGEFFAVREAKSEEDITRSILLQIILEEESAGLPLFSETVLAHIIRCYGHAMQGVMGAWLEKNIQFMGEMQKQWVQQSSPPAVAPAHWMQWMQDWIQQSQAAMGQIQPNAQFQQQMQQFQQFFSTKK